MNAAAIGIAAGSFVWTFGTVLAYFRTIPEGKVSARITGLVLKLLFGLALAITAIVLAHVSGSLGVAVIAPAALSTMLASMVLWLLTQRKTPIGKLAVAEGDALLPFATTTSEGQPFHSDELAGKRVLLKFFRGGW